MTTEILGGEGLAKKRYSEPLFDNWLTTETLAFLEKARVGNLRRALWRGDEVEFILSPYLPLCSV